MEPNRWHGVSGSAFTLRDLVLGKEDFPPPPDGRRYLLLGITGLTG